MAWTEYFREDQKRNSVSGFEVPPYINLALFGFKWRTHAEDHGLVHLPVELREGAVGLGGKTAAPTITTTTDATKADAEISAIAPPHATGTMIVIATAPEMIAFEMTAHGMIAHEMIAVEMTDPGHHEENV